MADPLNDPVLEDQLRLGERIAEAMTRASQAGLDSILDAAERKIEIVEDAALTTLARDLLKADPTS